MLEISIYALVLWILWTGLATCWRNNLTRTIILGVAGGVLFVLFFVTLFSQLFGWVSR